MNRFRSYMHAPLTWIAIAAILAMATTAFLVEPTPQTQHVRPGQGTTPTPLDTRDSDNDGLFDWEEELRGTDPTNADTDGDGAPDLVEVLAETDPRIWPRRHLVT